MVPCGLRAEKRRSALDPLRRSWPGLPDSYDSKGRGVGRREGEAGCER
jgi:hypothetical protein